MKAILPVPSIAVLVGDERLYEWRESLAAKVDGAEYSTSYKRGFWDGKKRPGRLEEKDTHYKWVGGRGMLDRFLRDFPDAEVQIEYPTPSDPRWDIAEEEYDWDQFRDYQAETIEEIWAEKWGRVGIATGGGKGLIIGVTAAMARDIGMTTLVLADEVSVFQALEEEIKKWGHVEDDLALVEAGRQEPPVGASIVLGMVPTIANRVDREEWENWLSGIDVAFLDEADRATADRWKDVVYPMKHNHIRVGFSGSFNTSSDADKIEQEELMGPVLVRVKNKELIRRDISAKPTVKLHKFEHDFFDVPDPDLWYNWTGPERRRYVYENFVIHNEERNELIKSLLHPEKQNAVVVERIEHGEVLEDVLPNARFMHGDHSKEERDAILTDFKNLDIQTLIATRLINRGTNRIRDARHFIIASGEGSETSQLQRLGRVLRKAQGKDEVIVHDIIDTPGYEPRNVDPGKYLSRASRKRIKVYHDEGFTTERV